MNEARDVLEDIVRASQNIQKNKSDYEKDGILYCGNCNTPKQKRFIFAGREYKPYMMCECEARKKREEETERKKKEFDELVKRYRRECFPESKMESWSFDNADGSNARFTAAMQRYVENFAKFQRDGRGIILTGQVGTGKTYLAACVANAMVDKGTKVIFTSLPRISRELQERWEDRQDYIDGLNDAALLILDDFGAERKTEYMSEIAFSVIDSRYRTGLPLIVTTNLTTEELASPDDDWKKRTYSRLLEMCYPIKVTGGDKRREKMVDTYAPMRDILGI